MKLHDFIRISMIVFMLGFPMILVAQSENEAPIADIGEFRLTTQALGRFGTVPHENVPKEMPNYYAHFSLWIGALDKDSMPHVSSAEEGITPEWMPVPLTWKEDIDRHIPSVKTMNQGSFSDVCDVEGHVPQGLIVTVTACGFDQKGFALYEFVIERSESGAPELNGVYVGLQADIDAPSGPDEVNGANDRIITLMEGRALSVLDGNADIKKDPLLGVLLPDVESPILSWWTSDSDPQNDSERYAFLSGKKCSFPLPKKEADYRFLLSDGPYTLGDVEDIRFTVAILYGRGDKKFTGEAEQAGKINSQYLAAGLHKSLKKPATRQTESASPVASFELYPAYPNPFNNQTRIRFSLPEAQHVKAVLYNLLGQSVCTLVNETRPAGFNELTWDGRNDEGNMVVSGVYMLVLKTETEVRKQKLILTK